MGVRLSETTPEMTMADMIATAKSWNSLPMMPS